MKYIIVVICIMLTGCFQYNTEKKLSVKEQYAGKVVFVYVFDDETQLWNRATVEMLRHVDCGKIRLLVGQPNEGGM